MNYGIKLNNILDKCNLSQEERISFEQFVDGKVYEDKEFYPDFEKSLREACELNSILNNAQYKVHEKKLWTSLTKLVQDAQVEERKKKNMVFK